LRRISFFSEIRSPRSVTPFFAQTPPSPPKKMPLRRSPYRLVRRKKNIPESNEETEQHSTNDYLSF
jgi:hypothetical protein